MSDGGRGRGRGRDLEEFEDGLPVSLSNTPVSTIGVSSQVRGAPHGMTTPRHPSHRRHIPRREDGSLEPYGVGNRPRLSCSSGPIARTGSRPRVRPVHIRIRILRSMSTLRQRTWRAVSKILGTRPNPSPSPTLLLPTMLLFGRGPSGTEEGPSLHVWATQDPYYSITGSCSSSGAGTSGFLLSEIRKGNEGQDGEDGGSACREERERPRRSGRRTGRPDWLPSL